MATGKLTHTLAQLDSAIDSINGIAAKFGVTAILPMSRSEYDSLPVKDQNTLYVVYSETKFELFYGARPISGAGGAASAGVYAPLLVGGTGGAGRLTAPEPL